jgi:hypothetical protein
MSDFFIYLEEVGAIESTEWAFENLSQDQMNAIMDEHFDAYMAHCGKRPHEVYTLDVVDTLTLEIAE